MIDTSPEIQKMQLDFFLSLSTEERVKRGIEMIDSMRKMVETSIRYQYPTFSEKEVKLAIFERYYRNDFSEETYQQIVQKLNEVW